MAINIRFGTTFDGKGLRALNRELDGLSSSIGSLGNNFAIAGAAFLGASALLGKAVMSASNYEAEFEGVNQVFKEAASSVQAFAETAAETAGLSATEALQAAKTFGLFATGAGLGVEEAASFSTSLVQLAGDLGSFNDVPAAEALSAIQSGLMGSAEPLRKFGVFLTDDALRAEALAMKIYDGTGALSSQQKMLASYSLIMRDTQIQQGDFVKYQDTLGNQLKIVQSDFANLTREIGTILIPVITAAMPQIKAMAQEIGEKLKTALESIDFASLIEGLVGFATFLIQNAELITNIIVGLFALNTIYKLVVITQALFSAATAINTFVIGQMTAGVSLATIALKLFRTALITTGIGAVLVGLGFLADYLINASGATDQATESTKDYGNQLGMTADQAERLALAANKPFTFTMPTMPSLPGGGSADDSAARAAEEAARQAAAEAERRAEEARRAEEERLEKRRAAYQSFADSVKSIFGQIKESILSSFNLPRLGNSVNSITRNIAKLLEKTKGFAKDITELSGLGLNSALLQQVIQAGPMAGSQLASAIVGGGSAFISQLNAAYGEFGNLASGIAGVGTQSAFANQEVVNNYYQIEVSGGVGSGPTIGKAIVDAIKSYERTSGAVWQGA
jgi:vacuolar-type H+-ATPase subunit E/Vma4